MTTADERMANLRATFATNNAPWDDRTEAALQSVIAAQGLEVAWWQMPPEVVQSIRHVSRVRRLGRAMTAEAWLDERYDEQGRVR